MSTLRSLFASLGLALAGLGLVIVVAPEIAGVLSLPRAAVIGLGIFALVEAARSLQTRRRTAIEAADPPAVEAPDETELPGDTFDQRVATLSDKRGRSWAGGEHERIRRRLRSAAIEAAAHRWRLPTTTARSRIESGDWTEDPAAAWFLGGPTVDEPPWTIRLRAYFGDRTPFAFYAIRATEAVVELREGS